MSKSKPVLQRTSNRPASAFTALVWIFTVTITHKTKTTIHLSFVLRWQLVLSYAAITFWKGWAGTAAAVPAQTNNHTPELQQVRVWFSGTNPSVVGNTISLMRQKRCPFLFGKISYSTQTTSYFSLHHNCRKSYNLVSWHGPSDI